jgi:endonuclease-3
MRKKERYQAVKQYFEQALPQPDTELQYQSPYQLLVAVILSAQCTDKRVNMTTPAFFEAFPDVHALANATPDEIYAYVKSISYPNNKAKHLNGMAQKIVSDFDGQVPADLEALQTLPGVGRKTANVVASVVFNKETFPVDTHVFRVAQRIGLVKPSKTPYQVEQQLLKLIPKKVRGKFHHWLILHGRKVCLARKPQCEECGISQVCRYYQNGMSLPESAS